MFNESTNNTGFGVRLARLTLVKLLDQVKLKSFDHASFNSLTADTPAAVLD
jgi:hypothetical protein